MTPGQIDALVRKPADELQTINVGFRVHACVATRALGRRETLCLVDAQGLRMKPGKIGCDANHVEQACSYLSVP